MNKLDNPDAFQTVFKTGQKYSTSGFAIWCKPNGMSISRLGMVIGKKAVKTAVKRNWVKRIVRESFRHRFKVLGGWDVVFAAYSGVSSLDRRVFRQQLDDIWSKIG